MKNIFKRKKSNTTPLTSSPFSFKYVTTITKENDVIEFEIKTDSDIIKVGSSSDYDIATGKFFDKRFYIDNTEYMSVEDFEKELLHYAADGIIQVIKIDGVKASKMMASDITP